MALRITIIVFLILNLNGLVLASETTETSALPKNESQQGGIVIRDGQAQAWNEYHNRIQTFAKLSAEEKEKEAANVAEILADHIQLGSASNEDLERLKRFSNYIGQQAIQKKYGFQTAAILSGLTPFLGAYFLGVTDFFIHSNSYSFYQALGPFGIFLIPAAAAGTIISGKFAYQNFKKYFQNRNETSSLNTIFFETLKKREIIVDKNAQNIFLDQAGSETKSREVMNFRSYDAFAAALRQLKVLIQTTRNDLLQNPEYAAEAEVLESLIPGIEKFIKHSKILFKNKYLISHEIRHAVWEYEAFFRTYRSILRETNMPVPDELTNPHRYHLQNITQILQPAANDKSAKLLIRTLGDSLLTPALAELLIKTTSEENKVQLSVVQLETIIGKNQSGSKGVYRLHLKLGSALTGDLGNIAIKFASRTDDLNEILASSAWFDQHSLEFDQQVGNIVSRLEQTNFDAKLQNATQPPVAARVADPNEAETEEELVFVSSNTPSNQCIKALKMAK